MVIPINRPHGVILTIIGVVFGVVLALSPGGAWATPDDLLIINGVTYVLDEAVTNQIVVGGFTVSSIVQPAPALVGLQEAVPFTDLIGTHVPLPVISDYLQMDVQVLQSPSPIIACVPVPFGCQPETIGENPGVFGLQFTLTSDSNPSGLVFNPSATLFPEGPGPIDVSSITQGLLNVSIQSDVDAPVPEPSTWLLLGSGLAGLAAWRRKLAA